MRELRYLAVTLIAASLAIALSSCGPSNDKEEAAPPQPAATGTATRTEVVPEQYLVNIQPQAETYEIPEDLSTVGNLAHYTELTNSQKRQLAKTGFVVVPDEAEQMFFLYEEYAETDDAANFITVDSVLQAYHIFFDYSLRTVEAMHLCQAAQEMTEALLTGSLKLLDEAPEGAVAEAAQRNVAYFAVAAALLDPKAEPPAQVKKLVADELELIHAHAARMPSPIFGTTIHYTQFNPRGHYTRSEQFEKYFRAMMWYGLIGFELEYDKKPTTSRHTRQALLITKLLAENEQTRALWDKIYEPTKFFVGGADDLRYDQYLPIAKRVFGEDLSPASFGDEQKLEEFLTQARGELPAPRIAPFFVGGPGEKGTQGRQFRLMGQRFIPDSYILQQLVAPLVRGQRYMPMGLDVAAALGSARARYLLLEVYDQGRYPNYTEQLDKMQAEFTGTEESKWRSNLYWGWLYSLLPLFEEKGEGYPTFMQSEQWQDKELNTSLSSWAELRHDTILYAKQSGAEMGGGPEGKPKGYVEPYPEVYGRLAYLAWRSRQGLEERGMLPEKLAEAYGKFEDTLMFLKGIAEKELTNEPRTAEEYKRIQYFGGELERLTLEVAQGDQGAANWFEITNEADRNLACVADVHTSANSCLEVGVGPAYRIYVVVPHPDGGLQIAKGGVFAYYEFPWPASDRLTDEKWQALLKSGQAPEQPEWTKSFVVPGSALPGG